MNADLQSHSPTLCNAARGAKNLGKCVLALVGEFCLQFWIRKNVEVVVGCASAEVVKDCEARGWLLCPQGLLGVTGFSRNRRTEGLRWPHISTSQTLNDLSPTRTYPFPSFTQGGSSTRREIDFHRVWSISLFHKRIKYTNLLKSVREEDFQMARTNKNL